MENNEDNIFTTNLPVEGSPNFIILHTSWNADNVKFQVFDMSKEEENEWIGELLVDELKTSATELGITFAEFYAETKQALCKPGGLEKFSYAVEDNKFIWRKQEKFKVVYGEVFLQSTQNLRNRLILDSIAVINTLREKYQQLRIEYQKQNVEFETYAESYKKCLEKKNSLEKTLLTKFTTLLNSKKDKIAELQQLMIEKNSMFPGENEIERSTQGDCELNQREDELTQKTTTSKKRGLLLPKRRKLIEETSNTMNLEGNSKNPACSSATSNVEDKECDADDIFNAF